MQLSQFLLLCGAAVTTALPAAAASGCDSGSLQCCNTVTKSTDPAAAGILALLGVVVQDVDVAVGLTCTPITVTGSPSSGCSGSAVCCDDNTHGGLISIGCKPASI